MAKAGRKPKFSNEELRLRMLEAGFDQLRRKGVFDGLDALRIESAIAAAEVPRAAAYKEFVNQENFRQQVLIHVLTELPLSTGLVATASEAEVQLDKHAERLASSDHDAARLARLEVARVLTELNYDMLDGSIDWRIYRSIVAASQTSNELEPEVLAAVQEGERRLIDGYTVFFDDMAKRTNLRLRPQLTTTQFAMAVYALNDGLANRPNANNERERVDAPFPKRDSQWTLFGLGFVALMDSFFDWVSP